MHHPTHIIRKSKWHRGASELIIRHPKVEGIGTTHNGGLLMIGEQRWKVAGAPLYVVHNGQVLEWEQCHSSTEVWY